MYFSKFFRARELAVLKRSDKRFVWEKPIRNTCRPVCVRRKKRSKIDPGAFRTEVPAKNVPKMHLGACPARFWRGLGASRASLGCLLGVLGRLLGALGCLLGASGVPLGRSWGTLGRILALMDTPGLDFGSFGGCPGWVWGGFECSFLQDSCMQTLDLHDALIAAGNFGFSFPPAARRYVRSTSASSRREYLACRIIISFILSVPASKACFQN